MAPPFDGTQDSTTGVPCSPVGRLRQVAGESPPFPHFLATVAALFSSIASGELPRAAAYSIRMLLKGYAAGLLLAALLTAFASATRLGADLLETLTSMFNPLPSIALLPLALLWFGLGDGSVIFVLIHAVLWSVALNAYAGIRAVSPTLRMVGQNYGLSKAGYVSRILIPGAFPSILTGLKIGWAFAWRTLSPRNSFSESVPAPAASAGIFLSKRISS